VTVGKNHLPAGLEGLSETRRVIELEDSEDEHDKKEQKRKGVKGLISGSGSGSRTEKKKEKKKEGKFSCSSRIWKRRSTGMWRGAKG